MASARAARRHGCEAPLHPSQIAVVAIGLLSAVVFYIFSVQELPELLRRTVEPLFSVQLAITALLFIIISFFDPSQPKYQATQPTEDKTTTDEETVITTVIVTVPQHKTNLGLLSSHSVVATCQDCGRLELTPDTRHCSRCNKCIPGYDHHCIYLNTCIGTRNYPLFAGLLSCSILLLFTQQIVTGYAIVHMVTPGRQDDTGSNARPVVLCLLSILRLLELIFLVILGSFDLYIALRGLTTYEWLHQWLERRYPEQADTSSTAARATEATHTSL